MGLFTAVIRLRDEHGLTTTKRVNMEVDELIHVGDEAQIGAARNMVNDFVDALDGIVDAVIESVVLNVIMDVAGIKTEPGEQGVAEGANLKMATVDNNGDPQSRPYWLPSATAGIFNANFRTVDTGDADLGDWLGAFNNTGVQVQISDGEEVTGIEEGIYATRRRTA